MIYRFEQFTFKAGETVLKEGTHLESILIVEQGSVEVVTECDGHEFVLDRLQQGSIINSRLFFTDECIGVNLRAKDHCILIEIGADLIKQIVE